MRHAGILLPIFSLPSPYGIGCFSKEAYEFVDFLAKSGQRYWQILPLGATMHGGCYDSPYQAASAFAGNPYFISLEDLIEEGVLTKEECDSADLVTEANRVDYDKLHENRMPLLRKAYERSDISKNPDYVAFITENAWWLDDYALFMAVRKFFGEVPTSQWPEDIRMHWGYALDYYRRELYFEVEFQKYLQFKFREQWSKLKAYANSKHIEIVGDIPIYVSPDGCELWANPELFRLDEHHAPTHVAGCPPDHFVADGQFWGNPLYRWDYHKQTGYQWWITRLWHSFTLYDAVRIDHFRGFDEYFAIPADSDTAASGHWEKGPGMDFFHAVRNALGERNLIAEDLGLITDSVRQLVKDSGFPNMKVMQFAFEPADVGAANEYLPHNHNKNCVVYTGTHDNDTLTGWLKSLSAEEKDMVKAYLDFEGDDETLHRAFLCQTLRSSADTCIIPVQDYLKLDNTCRINQPATVGKNWRWRLTHGQVTDEVGKEILTLTMRYGRGNWDNVQSVG